MEVLEVNRAHPLCLWVFCGTVVSGVGLLGPSGGVATTDPAHWGGFSPWMHEYESQSDSDVDRPEPDVVLDDLASRRFRSPSPAAPANYAIPASPVGTLSRQQTATRQAPPLQNLAYLRSDACKRSVCMCSL